MTGLCADTTAPAKKCSDVGERHSAQLDNQHQAQLKQKKTHIYQEAVEHLQKCSTLKVDGASHEAHCCFDL